MHLTHHRVPVPNLSEKLGAGGMGGFSLPSAEQLSSEMEATLGAEAMQEPMLVTMQQEKLLEKLNLDAAAAWDLILAFHDIFVLKGNEPSCTSAIEHDICITNSEPFKE